LEKGNHQLKKRQSIRKEEDRGGIGAGRQQQQQRQITEFGPKYKKTDSR
jgi:hypothetical protein